MNFYSQHGEDKLLARIFPAQGVCVEVGANDGITFSNTKHFEEKGWACVLVEPTPALCRLIRERRTAQLFECAASDTDGQVILNTADGQDLYSSVEAQATMSEAIRQLHANVTQISVSSRTLDSVLSESGVHKIDFMTIDVEGHEQSVLRGLSLDRWLPDILIVEDSTDLSETDVSRYLAARWYLRFYRTGGNDWYLRRGSTARSKVLLQILLLRLDLVGLLKVWLPASIRRPLLMAKRKLRSGKS